MRVLILESDLNLPYERLKEIQEDMVIQASMGILVIPSDFNYCIQEFDNVKPETIEPVLMTMATQEENNGNGHTY